MMITISTNYLRQGSISVFQLSSRHLSRQFCSHTVAIKAGREFHKMKGDNDLAEKAKNLIFGEKKYASFTSEEKRIVDLYQKKILKVDGGVILPNTKADLEQRELEQLMATRRTTLN